MPQRSVLLGWLMLWAVPCLVTAEPSAEVEPVLRAARERIAIAYFRGDSQALLRELIALKDRLEIPAFRANWHTWHYLAFLANQLGWEDLQSEPPNKERARHYLDAAIRYAQEANRRFETAGNYLILAASVGGKVHLVSRLKAPFLARKAFRYNRRAAELDPNSPHVLLAQAMVKLHTPRILGGDPDAARRLLERAAQRAESYRPSDPLALPLGTPAEIDAYRALLELKTGNLSAARRYAERALQRRPDFAFPQQLLAEIAAASAAQGKNR